MDRRKFLAATAGALGALSGCGASRSGGTTTTTSSGPVTTGDAPDAVGLDPLASGLETPVDIAFAPGEPRQYVAEQGGRLRIVEDGDLRSTPALDLRDSVVTGYETGLLGVALHPDFPSDRRLFVRYSSPPRPGTPDDYSHTFVLAEFEVGEDGRTVDPDSERTVMTIPQPQANHNAGSLVFGPENDLYVGVGDGGAGGDQGRGHVEDWYDAVPGGNGQDVLDNLLGSVLRIRIGNYYTDGGYAIPADNPLVGQPGLIEQFAWGFRNPWRLAVDGEDLYAGDVGQNRFEEINRVEKGGNYGWNVREGTHCYGADDCPDATPADVRGGERLRPPVVEYPHGGAPVSGISVITGNVYRGDDIPGLRGWFVFGDLRANGRLFLAAPEEGEGLWPTQTLPVAEADAGNLSRIYSFQRHEGELYVLGSGDSGGGVFRIIPASS